MVAASPVAWNSLVQTVVPEKADVPVLLCPHLKKTLVLSLSEFTTSESK